MSDTERHDAFSIRQLGLVAGNRLPIIANVRVGEKIDDPNPKTESRPKALDHFKVFSPDLDSKKRRIIHPAITKWLVGIEGDRPRRFPIMFLNNEAFDSAGELLPSDNFIQHMGLYASRKCLCRGDGGKPGGEKGDAIIMQDTKDNAGRILKSGTLRKGFCPCTLYDPESNGGKCKPHTVVGGIPLAADGSTPLMTTGGIVVFRSGGIMTASAIKSGMTRFAQLTNGWLAYLPFLLVVQMRPGKFGNVPVVHLESPLSDDELVAESQRRARTLLDQGDEFRRLRMASRDVLLLESAHVQADVCEEFSPATVAAEVMLDAEPDAEPDAVGDAGAADVELTAEEAAQENDEFFNRKGGDLFGSTR